MPGSLPSLSSNADQYEMVRELGRGVFGEVWLARKRTSGIEKAIKIVTQPADKDAAQREFRALELIKNLRHPYLLATEDFWVSDNRLHIVMELADCTLRGRLMPAAKHGHPGIPEDELIGYIREAAEGLDYLHGKHVVHRDVKPDNILLLHGHAKVADFGLARQQDKTMGAMKTFAGTPAYMAPEIWGKRRRTAERPLRARRELYRTAPGASAAAKPADPRDDVRAPGGRAQLRALHRSLASAKCWRRPLARARGPSGLVPRVCGGTVAGDWRLDAAALGRGGATGVANRVVAE